jgi:hypothetical protein
MSWCLFASDHGVNVAESSRKRASVDRRVLDDLFAISN